MNVNQSQDESVGKYCYEQEHNISNDEHDDSSKKLSSRSREDGISYCGQRMTILAVFCLIILVGIILLIALRDDKNSDDDIGTTQIPLSPIVEYPAFADISILEGTGNGQKIVGSQTWLEVSSIDKEITSRVVMAFDLKGLPVDNIFRETKEMDSEYSAELKLWVAETTNEGPLRVLLVQEDTTENLQTRSLENINYETTTRESFSYSVTNVGDSFVLDSTLFDQDGSITVDVSQLVHSRTSNELLLLVESEGESNGSGKAKVVFRSREFEDGTLGPVVIIRFPTSEPTNYPSTSLAPSISPSTSILPSLSPSNVPTRSAHPSHEPSELPSLSKLPSQTPSTLFSISNAPSGFPTTLPSSRVKPSSKPSYEPSMVSSDSPTRAEMQSVSAAPSASPLEAASPISVLTPTPTVIIPGHLSSLFPSSSPQKGETEAPIHAEQHTVELTMTQFCVIADVPYTAEEEAALPNQIANQTDGCEFLIHLGDIMGGSDKCAEEKYFVIRDILTNFSDIPVFMVPGDNEWNDCGNQTEIHDGWNKWTTSFLRFEENWEQHALFDVERQPTHEENFSFVHRRTLFFGFNIVGGRVHDEEEWVDRLRDEHNWMVQMTRRNIPENADGIVIMAHAAPKDDHRWFFDPLETFAKDELKGEIPILYLHGDGHDWKYTQNWRGQNSLLQIQHEGGVREPILKILADPHSMGPDPVLAFQFDRQLHLSNIFVDNEE